MDKKITNIIKQAIDLHVHIGPEIIPRKYSCTQLVEQENGKIGGFALKNHFYPTTPWIAEYQKNEPLLIGSIVMNNSVGGLNAEAILATSYVAKRPFIVWLPTINAAHFLSQSAVEIPMEWVNKPNFRARNAKTVTKIDILDKNGALSQEMLSVLRAIKSTKAILATGHISWQESRMVVRQAASLGIKKIIVTHPIYQKINMPIEIQKELTAYGAFIEQCYSMFSIDNIPIQEIFKQIKDIDPKYCILSSDVGQMFSPPPSTALAKFAALLLNQGLTLDQLEIMLVNNPIKLIGS